MSEQLDDVYDLIIIGGTAGGLSVAISSLKSGLKRVRLIEPGDSIAFDVLVPMNQVDVSYGESLLSIERTEATNELLITTSLRSYVSHGCLIALRDRDPHWQPPLASTSDRVTIDELPTMIDDRDVLIVGHTDNAVELVWDAANSGARVVMAAGGMDPAMLAPAADSILRKLERERRATVLYRAVPDEIGQNDKFPIAYFNDRRTPDLEFDHIVLASHRRRPTIDAFNVSAEALETNRVWFLGEPEPGRDVPTAQAWQIGSQIAEACFPDLAAPVAKSTVARRARHQSIVEELRADHYNATITRFEPTHSDLWVLRVRPDHGDTSHIPGQYASLGLGYWEDRIDDAIDNDLDNKWEKLIRRSYSISHPIFEPSGYLAPGDTDGELEFYIVLVQADENHVPALTPRLARKTPGDRIYLGPKVAGRYTLESVDDPADTVIFFATGTGEAPHNSMIAELLRKGHTGPIIATVTVRNWVDLGYLKTHRELEARYPNYHYIPMPTREPDVPKQYLQDLITNQTFDKILGHPISPDDTHAFLCGNPAMIGLPEDKDGDSSFPEPVGVVQLLTERGFTLDKRNRPGNIHYEEYW